LRDDDESVHVVKIVCSTCFESERLAAQLVSLSPLSDEHDCMDCGRNPARYSKSLMMAMCDACRTDQGTSFLQFSFQKIYKNKGREIPSDIYEGRLYLGSQEAAANAEVFSRLGVTHVLVCGNGLTRFYEDEQVVRYHQLPIDDSLDQNLEIYLPSGVRFIDDAISSGGNVLVHCHAGISRSASLVIAWIMQRMQCDYHSAYAYVKSKRSKIHPNSNFIATLQQYWEPVCCAVSTSSSSAPASLSTWDQFAPASSTSLSVGIGELAPSTQRNKRKAGHLSQNVWALDEADDLMNNSAVSDVDNRYTSNSALNSALDSGLRTAMKSTSHSIRRFSAERMDPNSPEISSAASRRGMSNEMNDDDDKGGEKNDNDFVLVLRSDTK
jgi:predicted protein tyrosine phosphatase